MLILAHGDNLVSSRQFLDRFKSDQTEIIDGKTFSTPLIEAKLQPSLLGLEKTVIIENPKEDLLKKITDIPTLTVIAWYGKTMEKITLSSPPWKIQEFSALKSKGLYQFLDSFLAKNLKSALLGLSVLKKESLPSELIIGFLNRSIVGFINYKEKSGTLTYYQSKQYNSLDTDWSILELRTLLKRLVRQDFLIKSGKLDPNLALFQFVINSIP